MILLAQQGLSNDQIADRLSTRREIVSRWRKRFFEKRLAGLEDCHRPGRPRVSPPPELVVQVKAIACEFPYRRGVPLSRWSVAELGAHIRACGLTASLSDTTIWRWLNEDAIRPWQHRCWIFPRDPHFEAKAGRILDLYQRIWKGRKLGPNEFVLSADDKDQHSGALPKSPVITHTIPSPDENRARIQAAGGLGLSRRPGRPPCKTLRPLRSQKWKGAL
ncbi:MAG TPA: helix-turn-helix domain-containing protein [Candidatus Limnocylindria bacterium]|nr:helix-turn-helix domain-containing protein [Candidatus Limnocylindria bacterium]